jgi:hypothetical protein
VGASADAADGERRVAGSAPVTVLSRTEIR